MASILETCTSGSRPASPSAGDTVFETDTNRLLTYDGALWRTYASDGVAYSTAGVTELHYPTGLWSSGAATYYIGTSPVFHFDATLLDGADAGNNPADGTAIITWADRSGNSTNYDATQATASSQPTFTVSGPGSKPATTWASDNLSLAVEYTTTLGITQISVSQSTNATKSAVTGPATGSTGTVWNKETPSQNDFIGGSNLGDVSSPSNFTMHTAIRDTGSMTLFENGGTVLGTASNSGVLKVGRLGVAYPQHAGTISEILLFDSALSTADLNVIRLYLVNKYSLTPTVAFS